MNTLILYHIETNEILDVLHDLQNVVVEENNVYWDAGSMIGIQAGFVVVEGNPNIQIGHNVTPFLNRDVKHEKRNQPFSKIQNMINFLFSELSDEQINRALSEGIITESEANQYLNNSINVNDRITG